MSNLHTDQHDSWDAGGYCNALVLDDEGNGTTCGYRKPLPPKRALTPQEQLAENTRGITRDIQRLNQSTEALTRVMGELVTILELQRCALHGTIFCNLPH